ncbi:MAG: hypothetical protein OEV78_03855 [Spirochaetia bacterium]|nr:hypothetical protein [Spirochaetia bacterium]
MKITTYFSLFFFTLPLSTHAFEVSKKTWIEGMTSALPAAFCNSSQYFRQCFNITAIECEETALSATRICIKENEEKIPDVLVQPEDGRNWGTKIGSCAGKTFELSLIKKRINNDQCNDPSNWQ